MLFVRSNQWGFIRRKHNITWQHLSQMKKCVILARLIFFLRVKPHRAISRTSAATYKVMEPHWISNYNRADGVTENVLLSFSILILDFLIIGSFSEFPKSITATYLIILHKNNLFTVGSITISNFDGYKC